MNCTTNLSLQSLPPNQNQNFPPQYNNSALSVNNLYSNTISAVAVEVGNHHGLQSSENYGFYNQDQGIATNYTNVSRLNVPCGMYQDTWSYDQCYGYYTPEGCYTSCQYVNVIDMEDFMNNEKRKEKSRDAARCRRSRETEIFTDLSSALPLTQEQVSQLDKASIMRLAISYLKVRDMIKLVPDMKPEEKTRNDSKILEVDQSVNTTESVFLKTIDGFVMALSTEGDFVYVSENISEYLGINQIDLMGQNIYDYSHPCDHGEIKEMLSIKNKENYSNEDTKSYFLRLKCTLTSKGRSVNLKSASYKVIHCTGHMLHSTDDTEELESNSDLHHCMVAVGQPIPHPSNIEAPLPHQTFFTKHSLDMKFTYADEKMLEFLGYNSEDLVGKSVYEYHHATDMNVISTAYKSLFSKGQCETNRYRFLAKNGGFVWVLTQATLIYDKGQKPESVVCVNFIISGIECKDEIYAAFQLESSTSTSSVAVVEETRESIETPIDEDVFVPLTINTQEIDEEQSQEVLQKQQQQPLIVTAKLFANCDVDDAEDAHSVVSNTIRPQTATSKIFAPRTEEMNKGFLTFSDEDGLTLLKDEPDDLTHLAPVAGDVVSLETHPYLTEMLDEFLLKDGFCPLLAEEQPDPFIAYRGSCEPSPQLLSPNILKNSECSLTSLNSPTDSLSEEDQMTSFISFPMEEDPELVAKAPYISMAMGDDLPLMNSDDLMWSTVNTNNNRTLQQIDPTPASTSSLAELLSASVNKHSIKDDMPLSMDTRLLDRIDSYNKSTTQWNNDKLNNNNSHQNNGVKRNCSPYDISNKRIKSEPKDMMSSELLQQLISNNTQNNRRSNNSKNKSWVVEKNSRKAACVSQPSDSVLMNLLDTTDQPLSPPEKTIDQQKFNLQSATQLAMLQQKQREQQDLRMQQVRKTSTSLLDPDALGIPSLLDLTQQDYEVNAPVSNYLLQGEDLIIALNNDSVLGDGVI